MKVVADFAFVHQLCAQVHGTFEWSRWLVDVTIYVQGHVMSWVVYYIEHAVHDCNCVIYIIMQYCARVGLTCTHVYCHSIQIFKLVMKGALIRSK